MKKNMTIAGATVALLSLVGGSAAYAAQTRALPEGETLYAIDCQNNVGQLVSVDVVTGVATAIGEGTDHEFIDCAADSAYDPISGLAYWASWNGSPNELYSMDITTGVSTYIGELTEATDDIGGLMMGEDGVLYAVYFLSDDDDSSFLGTVDTATGDVTLVAELLLEGDNIGDNAIWSTAYNPADGEYYLIDSYTRELMRVDVTTGAVESLGVQAENEYWWGMAFDSNGTIWSTGDEYIGSTTVDGWATAGTVSYSDDIVTLDGNSWYSESNFIVYDSNVTEEAAEEELAETGIDSASILGFAAVLLGGATAVTVARRRARR